MVSALPGSPDTPHEECYLRRTGRYRPFLSTDVVTSLEVMMMMMMKTIGISMIMQENNRKGIDFTSFFCIAKS